MKYLKTYIVLSGGYLLTCALSWLILGAPDATRNSPMEMAEVLVLSLVWLGWIWLAFRQRNAPEGHDALLTLVPIFFGSLAIIGVERELNGSQVSPSSAFVVSEAIFLLAIACLWVWLAREWWRIGRTRWDIIADTLAQPMILYMIMGMTLVISSEVYHRLFDETRVGHRIEEIIELLGYLTLLYGVAVAHMSWDEETRPRVEQTKL